MQTIIVTGGNRGLGYEIAQALSTRNTHLIITCRDVTQGKQVAKKLSGSYEVLALDLCSEQSIDLFVETVKQDHQQIDVLMNNAGIFDNVGHQIPFLKQSFSNVWVTNTLGPYLLTKKLAPLLEKANHPKCVFTSSVVGHHKRLNIQTLTGELSSEAYGQSKYADLLLTELFAREYANWQVLATHPGYTNTDIFNGRIAGWQKQVIRRVTDILAQSPAQGAQSAILASTQDFPSGTYIGPKYMMELYGPPQIRQIKKYYHPADLALFTDFLHTISPTA